MASHAAWPLWSLNLPLMLSRLSVSFVILGGLAVVCCWIGICVPCHTGWAGCGVLSVSFVILGGLAVVCCWIGICVPCHAG